MKDKRLQLRFSDVDERRAHALAKEMDLTVSAMIRVLIGRAHRETFGYRPSDAEPSAPSQEEAGSLSAVLATNAEHVDDFGRAAHVAHYELLQVPPTEFQVRFYELLGTHHGISSGIVTDEHADAVLVAAIAASRRRPDALTRVFVPSTHRDHILARGQVALQRAPNEASAFARLRIGIPSPWPAYPPEQWVAYGISRDDDVPGWLRRRLAIRETTQIRPARTQGGSDEVSTEPKAHEDR
jgi:hypothetical protein